MPPKRDDDVTGRELELLIDMVKDLKKDFKDHATSVFNRLNALNCGHQDTRLTMIESQVKTLEAAPEKRRTAVVAWSVIVLSTIIGVIGFFKR